MSDNAPWWVIHTDGLRAMLDRVKGGEDPELVLIEEYANCEHEADEEEIDAPDPVEVFADSLEEAPGQGDWPWRDHCERLAESALQALVEESWRIVLTDGDEIVHEWTPS